MKRYTSIMPGTIQWTILQAAKSIRTAFSGYAVKQNWLPMHVILESSYILQLTQFLLVVGCIAAHRTRKTSNRYPCIHLPSRLRKPNHFRWRLGRKTILQTCNRGGSGRTFVELLQRFVLPPRTFYASFVKRPAWRARPCGALLQPHQGQFYYHFFLASSFIRHVDMFM